MVKCCCCTCKVKIALIAVTTVITGSANSVKHANELCEAKCLANEALDYANETLI